MTIDGFIARKSRSLELALAEVGANVFNLAKMSIDSDSDSSSSSSNSAHLDQFGRPFQKPIYSSTEVPSIVARLREFLPRLKNSPLPNSDPRIDSSTNPKSDDILIPRLRSSSDVSNSSNASDSSFGIEIDLGCGVFDVNGDVDEDSLVRKGVPIIEDNTSDAQKSQIRSVSLIQELEDN